jgi:HlyD family secretion protein
VGRRDAALVLPNDALTSRSGDRGSVLVVRDGKVERAEVKLGLRGTAFSEVIAGVAAGEWVLEGATAREGTRVRVREQPLPAVNGHGHGDGSNELPVRFD